MEKIQQTRESGRRGIPGAIGIGVLFMVVALVVQTIIESVPSLYILFIQGTARSSFPSTLYAFESSHMLLYAVFIGVVAGICQESAKYVAVDTRPLNLTLYVGLGFSIVDIAVLMVESGPLLLSLTAIAATLILLNAVNSLAFHPGTAFILKWGRNSRHGIVSILYCIIIQAIADGGLVYTDLAVIKAPVKYITYTTEFWSITLILTAITLVIGVVLFRRTNEGRESEKPVVY